MKHTRHACRLEDLQGTCELYWHQVDDGFTFWAAVVEVAESSPERLAELAGAQIALELDDGRTGLAIVVNCRHRQEQALFIRPRPPATRLGVMHLVGLQPLEVPQHAPGY